jgi:sugar lactone lactonase YvrE
LYLVTQNGEVMKVQDGHVAIDFTISGQLSGITIDKAGKTIFLDDLAKQGILNKFTEDKNVEITSLVKDFEGVSLLGPNSLAVAGNSNHLFFTDSGPFGETSLENPKGSLFLIDLEAMIIKPLALNCLAYPTGLALSLDEKNIYVCETCSNRILRFSINSQEIYHFSVFHQFSGRFGPTAIAVSTVDENIYVSRYEFSSNSKDGLISILNSYGQQVGEIQVPNAPEITGLTFSKYKPNVMYITENSTTPTCYKVIQSEETPETEKQRLDASSIK